jgi:hypothetical protein
MAYGSTTERISVSLTWTRPLEGERLRGRHTRSFLVGRASAIVVPLYEAVNKSQCGRKHNEKCQEGKYCILGKGHFYIFEENGRFNSSVEIHRGKA